MSRAEATAELGWSDTLVRRFVMTTETGLVSADGAVWPDGLMVLRARSDTAYSVHPGGVASLPGWARGAIRWIDQDQPGTGPEVL